MGRISEVIKYEGDNNTLIWKHPCEDFNTNSQLIVHETQEAVFFLNGQALDLFGSGRYTLETQNIPLIKKFVNISTGRESAFHCEVYFINKTEQMAIRWGTDSRVQYIEPTYKFPLSVGASGEMSLRAADSKTLLMKLVGTEKDLSQSRLISYFRAFLMARIKTYIAQSLKESSINIFELDEQLIKFSDVLKEKLQPDFADYGISLEKFFVTTIVRPKGETQYEKFKELYFRQYADITEAKLRQQVGIIDQQTAAQKMVIQSQAIAQKRAQEGYTYQQERGFDVAEKVAANEAVGQFTNVGIGIGTMAGVGGAVGGVVGSAINSAFAGITAQPSPDTIIFCDQCGATITLGTNFCENCGALINSKPHCVKCGFVFERAGKFCPKCGFKREVNDEKQ